MGKAGRLRTTKVLQILRLVWKGELICCLPQYPWIKKASRLYLSLGRRTLGKDYKQVFPLKGEHLLIKIDLMCQKKIKILSKMSKI